MLCASLAWAGFVFTNTVGDPGRGERIASEVLADDAARAEIVSPVTEAILTTTPATPEMEPSIAQQVDALLQSPRGAAIFIAPFAGSWARMLGEDDPRPAEFDVAPLTDEIVAAVPGLEAADLPTTRFDVPDVPLPRTRIAWMADVRNIVQAATIGLAIAAAIGFVTGFVIGDRRWTLRRLGLWAAFAGAGWVLIPLFVTWAAGQWATGADSVIEVAVREAVSGLRTTAVVLLVGGVACVIASLTPAIGRLLDRPEQTGPVQPGPNPDLAPAVRRRHTPATPPADHSRVRTRPAVEADFRPDQAPAATSTRRPEPTAAMPPLDRQARPPTQPPTRRDELPIRELAVDSPDVADLDDPDDDDLWDFYSSRS